MVGVPTGTGPHRPRARGARPMTHHDDVPDAAAEEREERESTPNASGPEGAAGGMGSSSERIGHTGAWTGGCGRPPGHLGRGLRCRCAAGAEPRWRGTPAGRTRAEGRLPQPGPATRGQARQGLTRADHVPLFPGRSGLRSRVSSPTGAHPRWHRMPRRRRGHGHTRRHSRFIEAGSRTDGAASSGPGRLRARRAVDGGRPGECRRGDVRRQGRDPSRHAGGRRSRRGRTATT